jgi:hypothetical protein
MVYLAKKLDMFRSQTANFLCCYLICADSTAGLRFYRVWKVKTMTKKTSNKAEDAK